jgi:hypothetical protein
MEAAHDEAVAPRIEQSEREALVATGLLEWVEPDEADPLDRLPSVALVDRGPGRQLVELARDLEDLLEVGVEDRLDAPTGCAAGQSLEPLLEPPDPAALENRQQQEEEDGDDQADDDRPEVRREERVEVDPGVLRSEVAAESSSRDLPPTRRWLAAPPCPRGALPRVGCYPLAAADRRLERRLGAAGQ